MARKSTIGVNPLDAVIPAKLSAKAKVAPKKRPRPKAEATPEPTIVRERLSILIPLDTVERARNAAYWDRLAVAQIVDDAINAAVDRMERARGETYPEREEALRAGRPLKRKTKK